MTKAKFDLLSANLRHVIRGGSPRLHHRDPFDRVLVGQALELQVPILIGDIVPDGYGVQRLWD